MHELRLLATRADDALTITVGGELDIATAPTLTAFLDDNVRDGDERLTLDLSELTFIGAAGLGLLVTLRARMRRRHAVLTLTGASDHFRRLLKITGLDTRFTLTTPQ
jgi:anti-sigma B factor antagonist